MSVIGGNQSKLESHRRMTVGFIRESKLMLNVQNAYSDIHSQWMYYDNIWHHIHCIVFISENCLVP